MLRCMMLEWWLFVLFFFLFFVFAIPLVRCAIMLGCFGQECICSWSLLRGLKFGFVFFSVLQYLHVYVFFSFSILGGNLKFSHGKPKQADEGSIVVYFFFVVVIWLFYSHQIK